MTGTTKKSKPARVVDNITELLNFFFSVILLLWLGGVYFNLSKCVLKYLGVKWHDVFNLQIVQIIGKEKKEKVSEKGISHWIELQGTWVLLVLFFNLSGVLIISMIKGESKSSLVSHRTVGGYVGTTPLARGDFCKSS